MRRVVITGAGSINALGAGVGAFADGLRNARCGIGALSLFDNRSYRSSCAAEVRSLAAPAWLPRPIARRASRSDLLALTAAREALDAAGWDGAAADIGVAIGATTGGMFGSEEQYRRRLNGLPPLRRSVMLATLVSVSADLLAQLFGCHGPRLTVSTACSSGGNALGIAADWIRAGRASAVPKNVSRN